MTKNINRIPHFIMARTPSELMSLCIEVQSINDKMFEYQIVYDGKSWFAWFHWDFSQTIIVPRNNDATTR